MREIKLPDDLVQSVMEETGITTAPEAVEEALRIFLQRRILRLRGKVEWEGDLEESRLNRFPDRW